MSVQRICCWYRLQIRFVATVAELGALRIENCAIWPAGCVKFDSPEIPVLQGPSFTTGYCMSWYLSRILKWPEDDPWEALLSDSFKAVQ